MHSSNLYNRRQSVLAKRNKIPCIPRAFIQNSRVGQVLFSTLNEFNFEERTILYLYLVLYRMVEEIVDLTGRDKNYISGTIILFSEKLIQKVEIFKKALTYNNRDQLSIEEFFQLKEVMDILQEDMFNIDKMQVYPVEDYL